MYYRTWTLYADLPAATLQFMAAEALGYQPGVTDGAWASVSGLGDEQPPEWMIRLRDRLAAEGIAHELY